MAATRLAEAWRDRLHVPTYQIIEAAKYTSLSRDTVADWHKSGGGRKVLSDRSPRTALSYMQLIEVAVAAAARDAGVRLPDIRRAREYAARQLNSAYPFAEYRFKTDGRELMLDYENFEAVAADDDRIVSASGGGQIAWAPILGRLQEFDYEDELALRWHLNGRNSPIIIDPRISFGEPSVRGIPTWALRDRWRAGDSIPEIADDYDLTAPLVKRALEFEGIDSRQSNAWVH